MVIFSNAGLCAVSPHESRVYDFQKLRIWLLSKGGFAAKPKSTSTTHLLLPVHILSD